MFDWNDEELANIIWGEAGENDDHIVPYPEGSEDLRNKKEWNQDAAGTKLAEQKSPEAKTDIHERKLGSCSKHDTSGGLPGSGYTKIPWPDLSLSSADKIDQSSLGTEVSKHLSELSKFSSSREETTQLEKDVEVFQNSHEGKEQGDFVDYGWANIGSFDDLDRIFSNDDPIFGHVSLDNSEGLWSSKDVSNSLANIPVDAPSPAGSLRNRSEPLEIKEKSVQRNGKPFALSYEQNGDPPSSKDIQNSAAISVDRGCTGGTTKPTGKEQQILKQKNLLKARKTSQVKQEGKALQDFYGNWSSSGVPATQFENQLAPSVIQSSPSSVLGKQKQLQGTEALYQNIMNPYVASSVYGNLSNTYTGIPILSQTQPGDLMCQALLSGYEVSPAVVNPVIKSLESVKPQTMTPQEKIEKLRRRQQMQAMLAIQKQQQQLGQQVPSTNKSITQKCPTENQSNLSDGADPENEDTSLPSLDPPIEQGDSNTVTVAADNDFVEETILYRLQDIISKLDIKIRLCIRDSLFRLAQSAMQRHYASDTSSTNKSTREELEVVTREESNSQNRKHIDLRFTRASEVETETNPIDRIVAHLLFHRPLDLTANYSDKMESPASTKVQSESNAANLEKFPLTHLPDEDLKSNEHMSHLGFKNSWSLFEAQLDQVKNSPCVDTSENASNMQELEASK